MAGYIYSICMCVAGKEIYMPLHIIFLMPVDSATQTERHHNKSHLWGERKCSNILLYADSIVNNYYC